jgi:hypothetical protein
MPSDRAQTRGDVDLTSERALVDRLTPPKNIKVGRELDGPGTRPERRWPVTAGLHPAALGRFCER